MFSNAISYELAQATDGTLSISKQTPGLVSGLMGELQGLFNGGTTGSVGMSHTAFAVGLPIAAAVLQKKQDTGVWAIPFTKPA